MPREDGQFKGDDPRINRNGSRSKLPEDVRDLLEAGERKAAKTVVDCLDDEDGNVRLKAAALIFDRLRGRPPQAITGPEGEPLLPQLDLSRLSLEQLRALDAIRRSLAGDTGHRTVAVLPSGEDATEGK